MTFAVEHFRGGFVCFLFGYFELSFKVRFGGNAPSSSVVAWLCLGFRQRSGFSVCESCGLWWWFVADLGWVCEQEVHRGVGAHTCLLSYGSPRTEGVGGKECLGVNEGYLSGWRRDQSVMGGIEIQV